MLQCQRMTIYRRTAAMAANVNAAAAAAAAALLLSSSSSSTFTLPSHSTTILPSPRGAVPMPFNSNSRCLFRFTASTSSSFFKYDAPWLHYDNKNNSGNNTNRTGTSTPSILNFINGNFESNKATTTTTTAMDDQRIIPIYNPSTNNQLSYISESSSLSNENSTTATPTSIMRAIEAAKQAFPSWSNTPVQNRQRYLLEYAHLLHTKEVREEIAYWITLEQGKTTADAMGDVWRGLEVVEAATRVGSEMMGDSLQNLSNGLDTVSYRMPLGVCAGIAPFNFPAMIPLWMFPIAVATGNTYILKPTEKAPSASLLLVKYLHEIGLPPGVVNVVNGGKATVDAILTHPDIKAISFVGSNAAGEYIHDVGSKHGKRVQANLGAKNHATVMTKDADRASTIKALVGAAFGAAGQRCMALSVVIFVCDTLEEGNAWANEVVEEARKLKVGNGFEEGVDIGPLISKDATERAEKIIQQSIDDGASCMLDGRGITVKGYENGNFLGPTVLNLSAEQFTDPRAPITNPAYAEEIFAPVLTILAVPTLEDAILISNNNRYGNGTSIFTTSGGAARKYQYEIEAGQVGINVPIPVPLPFFSFTGNKSSIRGDVNFYGKSGVNFFTQLKTVTSNWQYAKGADLGGVTMPVLGKK